MPSTATTTTTVRADAKGRLTIPRRLREELGIEPGDTFFLDVDSAHGILRFAKAENPIDVLTEYAVREFYAGNTLSFEEVLVELNITLDDEK